MTSRRAGSGPAHRDRSWPAALVAMPLLAVLAAAGWDESPTRTRERVINLAGKAGGSAADPTVTSTDPSSAPQDTTLDIKVVGSGFDRGSTAQWAVDGVATVKIRTNSTRYVSQRQLVVNITIAADADTTLYDIIVITATGKKGIGTELFAVRLRNPDPKTGYTRITLASLPRSSSCQALGTNEPADVVGYCSIRKGGNHAFFSNTADGIVDLGTGQALDVSDTGGPIVVGWTGDIENRRAAIWSPSLGSSWLELSRFAVNGCASSRAMGANGTGTVVAGHACILVSGVERSLPVVWTREGARWSSPQTLSLPSGYDAGFALDISTHGVILGLLFPTGRSRPRGDEHFVWFPPYLMADPLPFGAFSYYMALAVNDAGDVVGTTTESVGWRSILWQRNGIGWNDPLAIGDRQASGINNRGTIVGHSDRAYVWAAVGGRTVLGRESAKDINDSGVIVGYGGDGSGVMWLPPNP